MSVALRANRWGTRLPQDPGRARSSSTAQDAPAQPHPPVAERQGVPDVHAVLQSLLDENSRLIDQVRALTMELGRLQERVRQLEAAQGVGTG